MTLEFKESTPLSMGVELELQLINLSDFNLTPASPDILELLKRNTFPGMFTPEITESMIEVATDVHHNHTTLLKQLHEIRNVLIDSGKKLNIGICGGGTHPFQHWSEQRIFSKNRFKQVSALYGYLAQQFTIFGLHIHIGCQNGDEALFLLHALSRYVPHFIALSASSPFVQGIDTLFNSSRLNSVFAFPLSGRAPFILSWEQFKETYFSKMLLTGVVKTMKDFYWDIRPKPEYGTIEMRVCDTPLSVERAAALTGYMQGLCKYLLEQRQLTLNEDDYLVYNYNRFQACRFGLNGVTIDPTSYEPINLSEDILNTTHKLIPYCESLQSTSALHHIEQIIDQNNDAHYLRNQFNFGSVETLVLGALNQFHN
jgi:carboxylate-amine ligase